MTIKWGYALNQWKPQFDDFVRRRDHDRALKVISISGFTGVELTAGSGRWEPLGNPQQIAANFGSTDNLRSFVQSTGLDAISSWVYDPEQAFGEDLSHGYSPLDPEDIPGIVAKAKWFAGALAEMGGSVLVVRPAPSAWSVPALTSIAIASLADCWNTVGAATAEFGIRTTMQFDFLSSLRRGDSWSALVEATDPRFVGIALDTAELTIAGIDPVAAFRNSADRVWHIQYKDTAEVDSSNEYLKPHADHELRVAGGERRVPRWFLEPGSSAGLVDFPNLTRELVNYGYDGWVVVETDQSPHPASSAMLSGWYLQNVLSPIVH